MAFLGLQLGPNVQFDPYSNSLANLSMAEWQQATSNFYPYENQLIQYAENPQAITDARTQAQSTVDSSFAAQQGAQQRQLALMGVTPTTAQSAAMAKSNALAKAAAEAGAMNQAAAGTAANQMAALQGG